LSDKYADCMQPEFGEISKVCALHSMMTRLFDICSMVVETGIPQFHKEWITVRYT